MGEGRIRGLVLTLAAASLACAPAPRMGEAVDIAEESALIVWDALSKTQHFIRRASFRTEAKDFGFLVPTPTVPELAESGNGAFALLERITAPAAMQAAELSRKMEAPKSAPAAAPVTVIATAKVAGYDAAVLEATDAGALDRWLKEHGYHSSPELLDWYKPYIEKKWKITAFKIARGEDSMPRNVEAAAVRMSFKTDAPFFPYREPKSTTAGSEPRLLRVYFLGDSRPEGRIGAEGAWPGRTLWSKPISALDRKDLLELLKLPPDTAPAAMRLTEFADGSSPRPGKDDVFFSAAANQAQVDKVPEWVRELQPRTPVGSGIFVFLLMAGALIASILYVGRKRRKRSG